jgi:hypothetical protein
MRTDSHASFNERREWRCTEASIGFRLFGGDFVETGCMKAMFGVGCDDVRGAARSLDSPMLASEIRAGPLAQRFFELDVRRLHMYVALWHGQHGGMVGMVVGCMGRELVVGGGG